MELHLLGGWGWNWGFWAGKSEQGPLACGVGGLGTVLSQEKPEGRTLVVGPHFLHLAPKMDLEEDWESWSLGCGMHPQTYRKGSLRGSSQTVSSRGEQPGMVAGKGPNTVLVRRESPDGAASGEQTVGASWDFPGLSFGLDEVTVSAWL